MIFCFPKSLIPLLIRPATPATLLVTELVSEVARDKKDDTFLAGDVGALIVLLFIPKLTERSDNCKRLDPSLGVAEVEVVVLPIGGDDEILVVTVVEEGEVEELQLLAVGD